MKRPPEYTAMDNDPRFAHLSTEKLKQAWRSVKSQEAERQRIVRETGFPVGYVYGLAEAMAAEYEKRIAPKSS